MSDKYRSSKDSPTERPSSSTLPKPVTDMGELFTGTATALIQLGREAVAILKEIKTALSRPQQAGPTAGSQPAQEVTALGYDREMLGRPFLGLPATGTVAIKKGSKFKKPSPSDSMSVIPEGTKILWLPTEGVLEFTRGDGCKVVISDHAKGLRWWSCDESGIKDD